MTSTEGADHDDFQLPPPPPSAVPVSAGPLSAYPDVSLAVDAGDTRPGASAFDARVNVESVERESRTAAALSAMGL